MKRKRISLSNPEGRELYKELVGRYSRQMLIPQIGLGGQLEISDASVLIIGVGGIGSTAAMYLAGAGVGKLTLIDFDKVEKSNLHRQIIHQESFINQNKVDSALNTLQALNSSFSIQYNTKCLKINHNNAMELIQPHDIIIDATDNIEARYLISDACALLKKPLISGSAVGLDGQIAILCGENGPCYRCLHPVSHGATNGSGSCSDSGVLGPVPGLIGCLQAIETIKLIVMLRSNRNTSDDVNLCTNSDTTTTDAAAIAASSIAITSINTNNDNLNNNTINSISVNDSSSSSSSSSSGRFQSLINRQCFYDGISGTFHEFELEGKNDTCLLCGQAPVIVDMYTSQLYSLRGNNSCTSSSVIKIQDESSSLNHDSSSSSSSNNNNNNNNNSSSGSSRNCNSGSSSSSSSNSNSNSDNSISSTSNNCNSNTNCTDGCSINSNSNSNSNNNSIVKINNINNDFISISPIAYYHQYRHLYYPNLLHSYNDDNMSETATVLKGMIAMNDDGNYHVLLDVRNKVQFNMISFQYYNLYHWQGDEIPSSSPSSSSLGTASSSSSSSSSSPLGTASSSSLAEATLTSSSIPSSSSSSLTAIIRKRLPILHIPLSELMKMNYDQLSDILLSYHIHQTPAHITTTTTTTATTTTSSSSSSSDSINIFNIHDTIHQPRSLPTVYVLCRRGIASKKATEHMISKLNFHKRNVINIEGGIDAWREQVDPDFPLY